jgi:hypothetical protein
MDMQANTNGLYIWVHLGGGIRNTTENICYIVSFAVPCQKFYSCFHRKRISPLSNRLRNVSFTHGTTAQTNLQLKLIC